MEGIKGYTYAEERDEDNHEDADVDIAEHEANPVCDAEVVLTRSLVAILACEDHLSWSNTEDFDQGHQKDDSASLSAHLTHIAHSVSESCFDWHLIKVDIEVVVGRTLAGG